MNLEKRTKWQHKKRPGLVKQVVQIIDHLDDERYDEVLWYAMRQRDLKKQPGKDKADFPSRSLARREILNCLEAWWPRLFSRQDADGLRMKDAMISLCGFNPDTLETVGFDRLPQAVRKKSCGRHTTFCQRMTIAEKCSLNEVDSFFVPRYLGTNPLREKVVKINVNSI